MNKAEENFALVPVLLHGKIPFHDIELRANSSDSFHKKEPKCANELQADKLLNIRQFNGSRSDENRFRLTRSKVSRWVIFFRQFSTFDLFLNHVHLSCSPATKLNLQQPNSVQTSRSERRKADEDSFLIVTAAAVFPIRLFSIIRPSSAPPQRTHISRLVCMPSRGARTSF